MTYDFLQLSKETYPDLFWLSPAGWHFASMEHLRAEVREQIRASQRRLCELLAGMLLAKNKVVHVFVSCPHGRRVLRRVCAKFSNLGISFPGSWIIFWNGTLVFLPPELSFAILVAFQVWIPYVSCTRLCFGGWLRHPWSCQTRRRKCLRNLLRQSCGASSLDCICLLSVAKWSMAGTSWVYCVSVCPAIYLSIFLLIWLFES